MRTFASDIVQDAEHLTRVRALIARAIGNDPRLTGPSDRARVLELRGLDRYMPVVKSAELATTAEDVAAYLAPLGSAVVALVGQASAINKIPGVTHIPIDGTGRIQAGTISAIRVSESARKPVMLPKFGVPGELSKVSAMVACTMEMMIALDPAAQEAVAKMLISAVTQAFDGEGVAALTAGSPLGSAAVGDLLGAISGGAPVAPVILGGTDALLGLAPGVIRDLQAIGIPVLPCAAATGLLIAIDGAGLVVGAGPVEVSTAGHASLQFSDGASPEGFTWTDLWSNNLVALRAEQFVRFGIRVDAVAYATVGSPA